RNLYEPEQIPSNRSHPKEMKRRLDIMIEGVSHITFIVNNLDKTTQLFKELFNAKEIYYSGERKHSLFKERFFIIGNQ
ncbi:hypothetical protein ACYJ2X_003799, partial [Clostridium botulinum]